MVTRILLLGAGAIAHHHATAARKLTPVPQIIAADPGESARTRFKEAFPEAEVMGSVDALLARPVEGVEVVIVATPPFLHHAQALAALASGRHVLVEKPLVFNVAQAESLWVQAQAQGVELACCSSRFSTRALTAEIRRRLQAGDIGEGWRVRWQVRGGGVSGIDYQPQSRWFLDRSKAGGGSLFDWGPYDVAMWMEIFQPVSVTVESAWLGYPRRGVPVPPDVVFDVEHQVIAHLRLKCADGRVVPVLFERSGACHGDNLNVTQIEGTHGALDWDWLDWVGDRKIRWHHERAPGDYVVDEVQGPADVDGLGCHDRPLHALVARLSGRPMADVNGAQALFNFRVLSAIYDVAAGGFPVTLVR